MRLNRRAFFAFVTSFAAVLMTSAQSWGQTAFGLPPGTTRLAFRQSRGSGRVASLQDQLNFGLRARRDIEFRFIAEVVKLVEQNKLPVKLVMGTFDYARKQRTRHPFQYFYRALIIRAARLGVPLRLV